MGGRIDTKLTAFYDGQNNLVAKYVKIGDDQVLELAPNALVPPGSHPVLGTIRCKYKDQSGNVV